MLAEIITFAGIVCAGVLTEGETGGLLSQCIVGLRFAPGTSARNCPYQGLGMLDLGSWAHPHLWLFLFGFSRCLDPKHLPAGA